MQWFQHSTDSHDDPDIADAEDRFGDAGYSVFFKVLEIYGREFNSLEDGDWLTVSQTFLRRKVRKSWTKVEQILDFYQQKNRIFYEMDGDKVRILIPKFVKIASNWTKRPKKDKKTKPTEAPTEAPTAKEVEIEGEGEKKESSSEDSPKKTPNCPYHEIVDLYHKTCLDLPEVKSIEGLRDKMRARWKEHPEIDWWNDFFQNDVHTSDYLCGRKVDWKASLDWILGPKNMSKILNGQYLNQGPMTGSRRSDDNLRVVKDFIGD